MTGAAAPNAQTLIDQAASGDEVAFALIVGEHHGATSPMRATFVNPVWPC